jgi:hypothetical protein
MSALRAESKRAAFGGVSRRVKASPQDSRSGTIDRCAAPTTKIRDGCAPLRTRRKIETMTNNRNRLRMHSLRVINEVDR